MPTQPVSAAHTNTARPSEIEEWASRLRDGLRALSSFDWLRAPPDSDSPELLKLLLDARENLAIDDAQRDPVGHLASTLAARLRNRADTAADAALELGPAIERRIAHCLDAGQSDNRVIRVGDFRASRMVEHQTYMGANWFVAGLIDTLPEGHWLPILPQIDRSRLLHFDLRPSESDGRPGIVLGPVKANGQARPFYSLENAIRWSWTFRQRQLERLAQQAQEARQERQDQAKQFWNSQLGQMELARQALDRLRENGQLPEYLPASAGFLNDNLL